MEKDKVERTVVHVELFADNSHHYFGSLAAIFEKLNKEQIGITYGSLRNYGLSANKPYKINSALFEKVRSSPSPKAGKE